jgi:hypothetical protein
MPYTTYSKVLNFFQSSPAYRYAQRGNVGIAVTQLTVQSGMQIAETVSPIPLIPISFAQVLNSSFAIFRKDTYITEKIIQGFQAFFAGIILGLAITLVFNNNKLLEQILYIFQLLYSALLLVSWGGSEISQSFNATATPNIVAPHMLKGIIKSPDAHDIEERHQSEQEMAGVLILKTP